MDIELLKSGFFTFTLILPRILAAFAVLPFLGKNVMGGAIIRNGVVASFALFLYPIMDAQLQGVELDTVQILLIILKEIFIGVIIGYIVTLPFWAMEAAGFFIDNQRGSTMASSLNPLSGSQTSPLGILLVQAVTTTFFVTGTFSLFLGGLYKSYIHWPVISFFPLFNQDAAVFYLNQLDLLMTLAVVFAAPVIIAMFLTEYGLGLVSRFSPQLNVFFLSMPIKSGVAIAVLIVYLTILMALFGDQMKDIDLIFLKLNTVFSPNHE